MFYHLCCPRIQNTKIFFFILSWRLWHWKATINIQFESEWWERWPWSADQWPLRLIHSSTLVSVCLNALFIQSDVWHLFLSPSLYFQSALPVDQAVCKRNRRERCLRGPVRSQYNIEQGRTREREKKQTNVPDHEDSKKDSLGPFWVKEVLLHLHL